MNVHWFNVKESYFNGYRAHIDPFYKDPNGQIMDYKEHETVYTEPYYTDVMRKHIDIEGRKYMFGSNSDWLACKQQLQKLNREGVTVILLK